MVLTKKLNSLLYILTVIIGTLKIKNILIGGFFMKIYKMVALYTALAAGMISACEHENACFSPTGFSQGGLVKVKKKKLSAYLVPVIRQSVPVIRQSLNALTHSSLYKYTVTPSFSVVTDLAALGYNIGSQTVDFAKKHPIFTAVVVYSIYVACRAPQPSGPTNSVSSLQAIQPEKNMQTLLEPDHKTRIISILYSTVRQKCGISGPMDAQVNIQEILEKTTELACEKGISQDCVVRVQNSFKESFAASVFADLQKNQNTIEEIQKNLNVETVRSILSSKGYSEGALQDDIVSRIVDRLSFTNQTQ